MHKKRLEIMRIAQKFFEFLLISYKIPRCILSSGGIVFDTYWRFFCKKSRTLPQSTHPLHPEDQSVFFLSKTQPVKGKGIP